jgi:murein DD-endopeptidase MepM/ murein hydrolase activator NlpD
MSQRKVRPGDHVEAGEVVGLGGNTGRSYGSHLHFEIRYMGDAIDPNLIVDPAKKSIRDWQFTLNKKHFDYVAAEVDRKYVDARKGSSVSKKFHTVKSGETLSSIARKHKTTINALCKLNKLKTSSKIKVGQKLRYK